MRSRRLLIVFLSIVLGSSVFTSFWKPCEKCEIFGHFRQLETSPPGVEVFKNPLATSDSQLVIADLRPYTDRACLQQLFSYYAKSMTRFPDDERCPIPFASWITALQTSSSVFLNDSRPTEEKHPTVPCTALSAQCQPSNWQTQYPSMIVTCPTRTDTSRSISASSCAVTSDPTAARFASAVILSHVGLSFPFLEDQNGRDKLKMLLWPEERDATQIWALSVMYESTAYYPAGADESVISQFNYTFGQRLGLQGYQMSYLPQWEVMLRPLNMTSKESGNGRRRAPIVWVTSNCKSHSRREDYVKQLMRVIKVDSFGSCLNNRDPGLYGLKPDHSNWFDALRNKRNLIYPYKFVLVLENSYEQGYVSEKIFDAWEAQAVPLYLGAPDIDDYVPGPNAYIDLRNKTVDEVAALVSLLDKDDQAYLQYHAWRLRPPDEIVNLSPLGRQVSRHRSEEHLCAICRIVSSTSSVPRN